MKERVRNLQRSDRPTHLLYKAVQAVRRRDDAREVESVLPRRALADVEVALPCDGEPAGERVGLFRARVCVQVCVCKRERERERERKRERKREKEREKEIEKERKSPPTHTPQTIHINLPEPT